MRPFATRSAFVFAAVIAVVAAAYIVGHLPIVQETLLRRGIEQRLRDTHADLLDDNALSVVLCGTGNPLPDRDRADACTAVFAGGRFFLVDAGPGAWKNIALLRLPAARLAGVLLTHYHSDHIGELGEINLQTWGAGRDHPLPVYGPPGVEQVVAGFMQAYKLDEGYRVAHHGAAMLPPENWPMEPHVVSIPSADPGKLPCADGATTVLSGNGLTITAFLVGHAPVAPAYGYRFDYEGRSAVVSGDTVKCPNLIRNSAGADLLIHEAQSAPMIELIGEVAGEQGNARIAKIMHDIQRYHTTPVEAAQAAERGRRKAPGLLAYRSPTAEHPRAMDVHARRIGRQASRRPPRLRRDAYPDARRIG